MSDCKGCNSETVPVAVYDSSMARMERHLKRMVVALIVAVVAVLVSNMAWLWAWAQYDYSGDETVYQQDGEGLNIIGDRNAASIYGAESNR